MQTRPDRTPSQNYLFYDFLGDLMDVRIAVEAGRSVPQDIARRLAFQPLTVLQALADTFARQGDAANYDRV